MTEGREVVEDYRSKGLTLRQHPLAFLRAELRERRNGSCADLRQARDGQRVTIAGLVLVRQKPGSAKGVMFMTIEDETDTANIIVWPSLFEKQRRLILSSGMVAVRGRYQREGGVTHLIAEHLIDLSDLPRSVGDRDDGLSMRHGRGDEAKIGTRDRLREGPRETDAAPAEVPERQEAPVIRSRRGTSGDVRLHKLLDMRAHTGLPRRLSPPAPPCIRVPLSFQMDAQVSKFVEPGHASCFTI
jgi:error-prone DNA polymerase